MGAAHGYGAAQGAAHDDGAALCPLQPSLVLGVSACRLSLVLPLSALHTSLCAAFELPTQLYILLKSRSGCRSLVEPPCIRSVPEQTAEFF